MGRWWFAQEWECDFLDAETAAFSGEDIEAAFEKELMTWNL